MIGCAPLPLVLEEAHPAPSNLSPLVGDFVAAVRAERDPAVSGEMGMEASLILAAIYAA